MLRVEVESQEVKVKSGTSSRTHKPYEIREQSAIIWLVDNEGVERRHPLEFSFSLDKDQHPYPVGKYRIHPSCLYVGQFQSLRLGRLQLVPEQPSKEKAA